MCSGPRAGDRCQGAREPPPDPALPSPALHLAPTHPSLYPHLPAALAGAECRPAPPSLLADTGVDLQIEALGP